MSAKKVLNDVSSSLPPAPKKFRWSDLAEGQIAIFLGQYVIRPYKDHSASTSLVALSDGTTWIFDSIHNPEVSPVAPGSVVTIEVGSKYVQS